MGTAVKWFPSRYLKERCRVVLGKEMPPVISQALVFGERLGGPLEFDWLGRR